MDGTEDPDASSTENSNEPGSGIPAASTSVSASSGGSHNKGVHRAIWVALVALVIVIGIFVAGGGKLPGSGSKNATTTPSSHGVIHGKLTAKAVHLRGDIWAFNYKILNTGTVPIAGFQLNGPKSNLYAVTSRKLWNSFGSGICQRRLAGILVYWSTGLSSSSVVQPGDTITLSFKTRTHGTHKDVYSLSWDGASPQFGKVLAPAASSLPVTQVCPK